MGRVALVTGGSRGIGAAISIALKEAGYTVAANYAGNDDAAKKFTEETGIKTYKWSVADYDACKAGIAQVEADLGPVDILVNNAGIQHTASIEEFPIEKWDAILALNLSAVFHATAAALPHMKRQGAGRIINIASVHGLVGSVNKSAYVAAKHGVIGFTKVTALENAGTGITANAICPGWVRTALVEQQITALAEREGTDQETAARALLAEKQPSLQFVTPEQLGEMVVFLASDAAAQITGTALPVDGGWTAR